jgi:hypothetical protein
MSVDNGLDQVQSKPCSICATVETRFNPVETIENPILFLGGNADALVSDVDGHARLVGPAAYPDYPAGRRVLDGVAHQV